jgi:hypothetical protein
MRSCSRAWDTPMLGFDSIPTTKTSVPTPRPRTQAVIQAASTTK